MGSNNYTKEQIITAAVAEKCRRSFYFFVRQFWETISEEDPIWNWHIEYLCTQLEEVVRAAKERKPLPYTYLIINIPPGTSKSTIVSEMLMPWAWTLDQSLKFLCGSYSSTPTEDLSDKCKTIVTSEKYITLFGNILRSDAMTNLKTKHNGQRLATTVGGAATGIHAHIICIDDPLNVKSSTSEADRLTANNFMTKTLSTRKMDKRNTVTILVMQRLHEEDCTGYLLKQGVRIKHICLPAELPPIDKNSVFPVELRDKYKDGLLDPIRLNREVLDDQRKALGTYDYSGQFEQLPADLSNGIIKWGWFEIVDILVKGVQKFVLDTAYTVKKDNDPTGLMAYFVEDNTLYITNWETQRLEFPELVKHTINFAKRNGYTTESIIRVEPKASGKSLVQQLQRESDLNISEFESPDKDKVTRATAITAILEGQRVKLLRGAWNNDFLTEVCTFPKAAHDEAVDCLVMAVSKELGSSTDWDSWNP